ncbi:alpha/beta hydrolase-fold protein [Gaetbulibacter aquiaggeris]|uniref:Alpha/beta hydrolase-fold protein n=1 Tax=Gaetbulibacter aquiaggeris TaxID=1735373 RepID=A0ABW7MKT8_9FLAO
MKNKIKTLFLIIVFSTVFSCSGDKQEDIIILDSRTLEDVNEDFKNLDIQPGINDVSLESLVAGVYWNFRIIVPSDASETNKRPLVMALHGASGGSTTAHQTTGCYIEPGLEALNAFIISPNAGTEQWYSISNQIQVINLLTLAKSNFNIDDSKVLVTGYSNGGNASWLYADFFPQYFTAAIAMASSYNPRRADGSISKINIPLYVIHSNADELFPIGITEGFVNDSRGAGSDIEFVIADGLSHYAPCDYVSYLQDAVTWLQNQIWI